MTKHLIEDCNALREAQDEKIHFDALLQSTQHQPDRRCNSKSNEECPAGGAFERLNKLRYEFPRAK